jgi:hypothetical protein
MSESSDDHSANSTAGEGAASALPHVASPSTTPDGPIETPAQVPEPQIILPGAGFDASGSAATTSVPLTATRGTALVLTREPRKETAAEPASEAAPRSWTWPRLAVRPAAASVIAVLLGAAAGSGATAGLLYFNYFNAAPAPPPADSAAFTAGLDRLDRELATLKASIDGSARQASAQIAKIADRMDRSEKLQAETGAKLAKTAEALDRLHRPAGNGAADATGSVSGAAGERTAALADPKRPGSTAQTAILDGWVLRDVYNGAAMIQTPRNGFVEVIPGDTLPGLGRIEGVRRQDGRWVVVTSRGLIVSR